MDIELPVKWQFCAEAHKWWRIGVWMFVDLSMPMVSVHVLWWTVGFGRLLDVKAWKTQVGSTVTTEPHGIPKPQSQGAPPPQKPRRQSDLRPHQRY